LLEPDSLQAPGAVLDFLAGRLAAKRALLEGG
jgi:hypothetical protein